MRGCRAFGLPSEENAKHETTGFQLLRPYHGGRSTGSRLPPVIQRRKSLLAVRVSMLSTPRLGERIDQ